MTTRRNIISRKLLTKVILYYSKINQRIIRLSFIRKLQLLDQFRKQSVVLQMSKGTWNRFNEVYLIRIIWRTMLGWVIIGIDDVCYRGIEVIILKSSDAQMSTMYPIRKFHLLMSLYRLTTVVKLHLPALSLNNILSTYKIDRY